MFFPKWRNKNQKNKLCLVKIGLMDQGICPYTYTYTHRNIHLIKIKFISIPNVVYKMSIVFSVNFFFFYYHKVASRWKQNYGWKVNRRHDKKNNNLEPNKLQRFSEELVRVHE